MTLWPYVPHGDEDGKLAPNDTIGGAVTAVTNCCANCVEPSRPQQCGPDLPCFWASRPCGPAGWLALLLTKVGDVETNPGPTTSHKRVWIYDVCYKQIYVRKQISIRCNMMNTGCTSDAHNTQITGPAIYTENPDSHLLLLFATTRYIFKSVMVSIVEIAKRTN